jgi:hypothetical protein
VLMREVSFLGLISVFLAGLAFGGQAIPNWSAPATWSPKSRWGLTAMGDVTGSLPFIGLAPCRILDTRGNGAPIQGGIFTGGSDVRSYVIPPICGVPVGVSAVSLNFTVTGPGQTGAGFLLAWPTGGAVPPVSNLNWDHVPAQVGNAAVVPTSALGSITVNVSGPTHVIMDINGYYSSVSDNPINIFRIFNNSLLFSIEGQNLLTSCAGPCGIVAEIGSTSGGIALYGLAQGLSGSNQGVFGLENSLSADSAAVFGIDATGSPGGVGHGGGQLTAGVRGQSKTHYGLLGQSEVTAISGQLLNSSGGFVAGGALGYTPDSGTTNWGVYAFGNIGASGAKPFVEVHPADPTETIRYVALEGPEAGTYFRGRARFTHGWARIAVPESFRLVTDEEGLTVQITPIGEVAGYAVTRVGLDEILVKGSKDVEFFYTVNGVRQTFKDWEVMSHSGEYMPASADARMPEGLSPEQKRRLIANGTYKVDGTVNIQTAERVGWTQIWSEREERDKAAAAQNAAARLRERK